MPIAAYVGANAMIAMPTAISEMVSVSADLRPTRSATAPSTMPPSGRVRKPTPNVAQVASSEMVGFVAGKYSLAMITAKKP